MSTTQAGKTTGQEPKEHAAQLARILEDAFNDYEDWKIEEAVGEHSWTTPPRWAAWGSASGPG